MTTRYYITLGASTTAGGKVSSVDHQDTIFGMRVALERDKCWCPQCNSEGVITLHGPRVSTTFGGREAALSDDLCVCKCNPPPRLVATQNVVCQTVDSDWHADKVDAAAAAAARLNASQLAAQTADAGIPLLLLDPETHEPFRHRPYRLELTGGTIRGTTDQNGNTRPLTAAERASFVKWHIDGATAAA